VNFFREFTRKSVKYCEFTRIHAKKCEFGSTVYQANLSKAKPIQFKPKKAKQQNIMLILESDEATASLFNESDILQLNNRLDLFNQISMWSSLFLIFFGCIGNLTSLFVFFSARHNSPKINGSCYMIALTITNTAYLCIFFYNVTLARIVSHFQLSSTSFLGHLHRLDTNLVACKTMGFAKNYVRSLNTFILLTLSCERLFFIYFPLKRLVIHPRKPLVILIILVLTSLHCSYILIFSEPVLTNSTLPTSPIFNAFIVHTNLTQNLNLYAIYPTRQATFCSFSLDHASLLLKLHSSSCFIILLSFVMISLSIVLIFVQLKRQSSKFVVVYKPSVSVSKRNELLLASDNHEVVERCGSKLNNDTRKKSPTAVKSFLGVSEVSSNRKRSSKLSTSHLIWANRDKKVSGTYSPSQISSFKSRMLLYISLSYVLLNVPYFLVMASAVLFLKRTSNTEHREFVFLQIKAYLILAEILQLANYSVISCVFFFSGGIFRKHLIRIISKR
jgi:hypothetical protein